MLSHVRFRSTLMAGLALLLLSTFTGSEVFGETNMRKNVSYNSVTELNYRDADHKLVYGDEDPVLQFGLLWLPANLAVDSRAPLVIFVHGGCWLNAYDIEHSHALSSALAEAGYAVWSLEYRRTGDSGGGWPGTFSDIMQGVAFTSQLTDYPVDLTQTVILGHSAGGHLALLASSDNQDIKAVIGLAAITDIVAYSRGTNSCQQATVGFMGNTYESAPETYHVANPASNPVHETSILLQGDADKIVPLNQSRLPGATTRVLEGAGHFDWIHPEAEAHQVLLSTLGEILQK